MEKEFVPYEQALALKELEFDEPCLALYVSLLDGSGEFELIKLEKQKDKLISAPLYQQAFRWFREKFDLDSHIKKDWTDGVLYGYESIIECQDGLIDVGTFDYEEAELECLIKLIELCKKH